jgi:hypothetical protein
MPWERYEGGQRDAIIGGALFEGLARDPHDAEQRLAAGEIRVRGCQELGCVGSLAGIYTGSMPVFVVEDRTHGNRAFCNLYEGDVRRRLNYGCYDDEVRMQLLTMQHEVAPVLREVVERSGGIALKPIMQRALHMGDELHSRNTAATLLFEREITGTLIALAAEGNTGVDALLRCMTEGGYFFLRLSMAAAKATADAAHGVPGSSVVTGMVMGCREFAVRVSGLGERWFTGPPPDLTEVTLFDGFTVDDVAWMGGESSLTETVGLGGFAQAAAFPLQRYQGGTPARMIELNEQMYRITVTEHPDFRIPVLGYRGTPTGIDVRRVLDTGIAPVLDIGIAGREGGQIGAGVVRVAMECFDAAGAALRDSTR